MFYHERVPWHGGKKLVEEICVAQLVDDPVVAVAFYDGLVEVENDNNIGHIDAELLCFSVVKV